MSNMQLRVRQQLPDSITLTTTRRGPITASPARVDCPLFWRSCILSPKKLIEAPPWLVVQVVSGFRLIISSFYYPSPAFFFIGISSGAQWKSAALQSLALSMATGEKQQSWGMVGGGCGWGVFLVLRSKEKTQQVSVVVVEEAVGWVPHNHGNNMHAQRSRTASQVLIS